MSSLNIFILFLFILYNFAKYRVIPGRISLITKILYSYFETNTRKTLIFWTLKILHFSILNRVEDSVFAHSLDLINWKHEEMHSTIYLIRTKIYHHFPSLIHHIFKKCITDKKVFSILKSEHPTCIHNMKKIEFKVCSTYF